MKFSGRATVWRLDRWRAGDHLQKRTNEPEGDRAGHGFGRVVHGRGVATKRRKGTNEPGPRKTKSQKSKGKIQKSKVIRYTSPGGSVSSIEFGHTWAEGSVEVFREGGGSFQASALFRVRILADASHYCRAPRGEAPPHITAASSGLVPYTCFCSFRTSMPARHRRQGCHHPTTATEHQLLRRNFTGR